MEEEKEGKTYLHLKIFPRNKETKPKGKQKTVILLKKIKDFLVRVIS